MQPFAAANSLAQPAPTFDGDRRPRDNGGMDAISPEFRLEPTGPGSFTWSEWQIDDDHALMMHEPTRAVFSIYLADGTAPAAPSVYQLRARLAHVCDGQPVPPNLPALGASAINAFACMTARPIAEMQPHRSPEMRRQGIEDDAIPF
jgi:hypothetical protein